MKHSELQKNDISNGGYMKIYVTIHGNYEGKHVSLVTSNLDLAIKHFLDYSKIVWYNTMYSIEVWENENRLFEYGVKENDVINYKQDLIYEDIKNDFLKKFEDSQDMNSRF